RGPAFYAQNCTRSALLASEPHYRRNGRWSGGGPFSVVKESIFHLGCGTTDVKIGNESLGPFGYGTCSGFGDFGVANTLNPLHWDLPSHGDLAGAVLPYAAEGYKRTRPGNPVASLGQFLIELRDLPSIPFGGAFGRRRRARSGKYKIPGVTTYPLAEIPGRLRERLLNFRSLGSEYLNIVFGWKPFVSDLRKMYNLWKTIDARMAQIVRENGKSINRRATLEEETTTVEAPDRTSPYPDAFVGGMPPWPGPCVSTWKGQRKTTDRVWYAANYRYYIPDVGSSQWTRRARLALFGALPTPELLWEVMPWSWLIDWFSNVGDVISNLSPNAVDNLVQNYAYTMRHTSATVTLTATASVDPSPPGQFWNWPRIEAKATSYHKVETKVRDGTGAPFAFGGMTSSSLSSHQYAILAALGLSKSGKRLR
ncbi:maturation protein, partial [ssRNA phage Gerhypos.4_41]